MTMPELIRAITVDVDPKKALQLVRNGADPNAQDYGITALMEAARRGFKELVVALLDAGADVHARRLEDETAIAFAQKQGEVEIVEILKAAMSRPRDDASQLTELCREVDEVVNRLGAYRSLGDLAAKQKREELEERISAIGQRLFNEGGEERMLEIHSLVKARSAWGRYLEGVWDGIGTWLG